MNELGDTISWPTRDPGWVGKIILMGLITLIPIVGQMVLMGWTLTALDNLRAGRQDLPPAGFGYIGRGINLFVVYLLYVVAFVVLLMVFFFVGAFMAGAGGNAQGAGGGVLGLIGGLFILLGWAVMILGLLALYFLLPAIVVATERGGIGGGLNVNQVIGIARSNGSATLMAGLMTILAYVIGSIGSLVCGIGAILTLAYGYAMLAGIVRIYEQQVGLAPAGPPSVPPPYPPAAPA